MTIFIRLRRALCRHDWLPIAGWSHIPSGDGHAECRKCGVLRVMQP